MLLAYRCALASPFVVATAIEATEFAADADRHGVHAVPAIVIDDVHRYAGAAPERAFVSRLLEAVSEGNGATAAEGATGAAPTTLGS